MKGARSLGCFQGGAGLKEKIATLKGGNQGWDPRKIDGHYGPQPFFFSLGLCSWGPASRPVNTHLGPGPSPEREWPGSNSSSDVRTLPHVLIH